MKAVAYYRVSTAAQGRSGLGLEAQREAVESLCTSRGWEIVAPLGDRRAAVHRD
jgi:DNA invertase Pin-like site-specific DNA recombinase